jgi:tetratricopeptide (TPR) repeat protein
MKAKPINAETLEDQADLLMDKGKLRSAERILLRLLASDGNKLPAHFNLARLYLRTKQYDLAIRHARQTLKINPKEMNAHLNLGVIYDKMDCYSKATQHYRKELTNNPTSPETLYNLGNIYFERRQWQKASKSLRRCLELGFTRNDEMTVYQLGVCYFHMADIDAYIEVYTRYLESEPSAGWAAANLGRALLHARNYRGAVLWLLKAKRLAGDSEVLKDLEKAQRCLRQTGIPDQKRKRRRAK